MLEQGTSKTKAKESRNASGEEKRENKKKRVGRMSMKTVARSCLNVAWLRNRLLGFCLCRWADPVELAARWSLLPCSWHLAAFLSTLCLFYICGWEWCCRIEWGTYLALPHANGSGPYCVTWFHPLTFWSFTLPLRQGSADLLLSHQLGGGGGTHISCVVPPHLIRARAKEGTWLHILHPQQAWYHVIPLKSCLFVPQDSIRY